ncbi:hypothetical protein SAMN04488053_10619 [Alkalicoccus daliensis]|uniref:Uncharacterized protein n=1 Tax=Alkalicoccus daliensis TaxID=745820 RepID=A0A1H0G8V6_9BACI|nr:hypothetical protein SAMN04488053_10619 [Alkalicoccus daliensis]
MDSAKLRRATVLEKRVRYFNITNPHFVKIHHREHYAIKELYIEITSLYFIVKFNYKRYKSPV